MHLMADVFIKNFPKPKYAFILDSEQVLKHNKGSSSNTELPNRALLSKWQAYCFSLQQADAIKFDFWINVTW